MSQPVLGLRANAAQFALLVLVNAFVGAMVGLERTLLPVLAEEEFGLTGRTAILSFIAAFGLSKAAANWFAGTLSDRWGRKPILIAGWIVALPVPLLLIWAPTWGWVIGANVLLGVSQGLTWSTTVIMKIDLAGPKQRGLAMGLNEFAGYFAVAAAALAAGYVAQATSIRPEPFYMGIGFAVIGLLLSVALVRETQGHAVVEGRDVAGETLTPGQVFARGTWADRDLSTVSQAGLVNNLNDGMAWGLFPLIYLGAGMDIAEIGWLVAIYPAVWGVCQIATGALSDRWGRKGFIVAGMWLQAVGIVMVVGASTFGGYAAAAAMQGLGTAMVYPTLLAAVGDHAHPSWRAGAVGVYRLWRDSGYAVGALAAGLAADAFGADTAVQGVAIVTFVSGAVVLVRLSEARPSTQPGA